MSWTEIKETPRHELQMLLTGLSNYNVLHSFDGYDSDDIGKMSKDKPRIRNDYNRYRAMQEKYGKKRKPQNFADVIAGVK